MKIKQLLTKSLLVAVCLLVGQSAWAVEIEKASIGNNTEWNTDFLGDKSQAFAINSNGTWTFAFTNSNNGSAADYNNFLLECYNGVRDEFVLRADNFETVRWANTDIATTYAGSTLATDLNGAAVAMTVTRNGYHISVSATITPTTSAAAFTYTYNFYRASGDLTLYLSVDHSHLNITSAEWEAQTGTITETKIVNLPNFGDNLLFTNVSRITVSKDEEYNNLKFTNANNSQNGYSLAKYDFSSLIGNDAAAVKVTFNYYLPNANAAYQRGFTFGQADLRTGFGKQSYSSNGAMFFFGLSRNGSHNYFSINKASTVDAEGSPKPAEEQGLLAAWATAEVMIDLVKRTVSYKIIGTSTVAGYDIAYMNSSDELAKCNQIDFFDCQDNKVSYLANLVITKYVDSEASPYSITAVDGNSTKLKTYAAGMYKSGVTNKTVKWDRYINVNDQWYGPSSGTNCTQTISAGGNTDITYPTSNIDYYFDEAQLSKTHSWATGSDKAFMSRGRGESLYANSTAYTSTTIEAGVYDMVISAGTRNGSPTLKYGYRSSDTNTHLGTTATWNNGSYAATQTFKNIVIPEGASLCFFIDAGSTTNSNVLLDYVTLTKVESVSKTLSSAGWSTYCSPYILDFSNAINGLTAAYIVTGGADGVLSTTPVNGPVPANTGLLLEGTANASVTIPVAAEATVDVTGNKLVGVTASESLAANGGYVLMTSPALAFYKNSNAFTLSANSAYLPAGFTVGAARGSYLLFGDDVTGISQVTNAAAKVGKAVYNLNGQRVNQPTKGLYIIEGKKVAIP